MYVILVNDDNTMTTSQKQRIIQRSKLVDKFWFLVNPMYGEHDMTGSTVSLEYVTPVSKRYRHEILVLSNEKYKNYLKYELPIDTEITLEAGSLELQLSFLYLDSDMNGNPVQRVRKTAPAVQVDIVPISAWSDIIPDAALNTLDQRILKIDAQMKAMDEYLDAIDKKSVDDLVFDKKNDTLQLSANGVGVGNKILVKDMLRDGIPVIDLESGNTPTPDTNPDSSCDCGCEDNVVEFGYSSSDAEQPKDESSDEDNVVEF